MKLVADDLAVAIDFHQTGLHQSIDVRIEAAEAGGELRRKHVDRALGEIDGRAAVVRFAIERAALVHVMRDVRDVHAEPEIAVRQPLDRDRIVEIPSVLAVDGHRRHAAEVGAAADVVFRNGGAEADGLGDRFRRMRVGNPPFADDDLGVDAWCVDVAEHIGDPADGAPRGGRPARQLDDHHLSRRRAALLTRRDDDVHQHAAVEWRDVAHAAVVAVVAADERAVAALEHPDDAPFGAAALLDALDANDDAVAVHRLVEMRAGNVDVAGAGFEWTLRGDEAIARRVRLQAADVEVHLLGQTETLASNLNEIARSDERFDMPLERRAVVLRHFENLQQLAHAGGMMHPLAHEREHLIA